MFKGTGVVEGIGRENGQNSSDAKDKSLPADVPVRIQFIMEKIVKADYAELFDGYKEAIANCRAFWENNPNATPQIMDFIENIEKTLSRT